MRPILDRWLTTYMAELVRNATAWPEGGVRAVLDEGPPHLIVVEPSEDSAGRIFPLVACAPQNGAGRAEANVWADRAWTALLQATEEGATADMLAETMLRIDDPRPGKATLMPPALWWPGTEPAEAYHRLAQLNAISSG